jgi:hypothetical protein
MASAGDEFRMPDGSVYIVRRAAAETGGEYVEMEFVLPARCVPPPPHVHRHQVEEYEVLEGRFDVLVDGTCTSLRAAGITRRRDPRVPLYLSKVMLDFDETLAPGRRRERLPMHVLARIARLLPGSSH